MLVRKCPQCSKELSYKTQQSYLAACKAESKCKKCGYEEVSSKLKGRDKSEDTKKKISEAKSGVSWKEQVKRKHGEEKANEIFRRHSILSRKNYTNPCRDGWKPLIIAKYGKEIGEEKLKEHSLKSRQRNGMAGTNVYKIWVEKYGIEEAEKRAGILAEKRSENVKGANNPMWGKPAPKKSGGGWSGWYRGVYFRSLLELGFLLDHPQAESAETLSYVVSYEFNGKKRNYYPDFVDEGVVYELKPIRRLDEPQTLRKIEAAKKTFCNFTVLTEKDVTRISPQILVDLVNKGEVILNKKWITRFESLAINPL